MSSLKVDKKYGAIYADPPWNFQNYSKKGTGRNAISHYDCMSVEEICDLNILQYAAKNCALFLWATDPLLLVALRVIEAWGFEYKTVGFCWAKVNKRADLENLSERDFFTGLGYWTRANTELCLLATRGSPPRMAKDVRRLIIDKRQEHSRKPEQVYGRIERLVQGPYLELFSRKSRDGWDCFGDQIGLFDGGAAKTRRQPSNLAEKQFEMEITTSAKNNLKRYQK